MIWQDLCPHEKWHQRALSLSLCSHRSHVSTQHGGSCLQVKRKGLRMIPTLLAPWSCVSQTPELWKINFCCSSHPVYFHKPHSLFSYSRLTQYSWIRRLNIIKISVRPRLIFRFNTIPIKIPEDIFRNCQAVSKIYMKTQRT